MMHVIPQRTSRLLGVLKMFAQEFHYPCVLIFQKNRENIENYADNFFNKNVYQIKQYFIISCIDDKVVNSNDDHVNLTVHPVCIQVMLFSKEHPSTPRCMLL